MQGVRISSVWPSALCLPWRRRSGIAHKRATSPGSSPTFPTQGLTKRAAIVSGTMSRRYSRCVFQWQRQSTNPAKERFSFPGRSLSAIVQNRLWGLLARPFACTRCCTAILSTRSSKQDPSSLGKQAHCEIWKCYQILAKRVLKYHWILKHQRVVKARGRHSRCLTAC